MPAQTNNHHIALQDRFQELLAQFSTASPLAAWLSPPDLQAFLQAGLSQLLQTALEAERQFYLEQQPADRANGFAQPRTLHMGTTPIHIQIPRTRQSFYPALLTKYQRYLPQAYEHLLHNILLGARSFKAALATMQALGLSYAPEQLQTLLDQIHNQAKTFFSRPLHPDWLFVFADAKIIHLADEHDQVRTAVHFLVVGVDTEGRKEILTAAVFWGNEVLEAWRAVLVDLKNRGLTRLLLLVTDDFGGLAPLLNGLFPNSDHQLCTVHMLRNAQRHLSPEDYQAFRQGWQEICAAASFEVAKTKLLQLLDTLRPKNKAYVAHLQTRADQYLAFMKYPPGLRPHLRSTNLLPQWRDLNNQIETLRRNAGGHFHSQREALIKIKLLTDRLYETRWKHPNPIPPLRRDTCGSVDPNVPPTIRVGTKPSILSDTKLLTTTEPAPSAPRCNGH